METALIAVAAAFALGWLRGNRRSTERAREAYAQGRAGAYEAMARTNTRHRPHEQPQSEEVVDLAAWAEARGRTHNQRGA